MGDITTDIFMKLRSQFFDEAGQPIPFQLRPKKNTQDDPFDEYLARDVLGDLTGVECVKAPGPLITPDMVFFRPKGCRGADARDLSDDLDRIVGVEVKKLERTRQGSVARSSGLDYNTTPPCGRVRVYDERDEPVDIRGFYLFVCLEISDKDPSAVILTALAFVDGDILNDDFDFYLSIVGEREKKIGLGTYGDGADRTRPMLIFSNPLGLPELDHAVTLVHRSGDLQTKKLRRVYEIQRSLSGGGTRSFYCYRSAADLPDEGMGNVLVDPFHVPERDSRTRPRGRFRLPFRV